MNKNQTRIVSYLQKKTNEHYIIPDGIKELGNRAMSEISYLKSITIPASVEKVEDNVFNGSSNLKTITFKGTKEPVCQLYAVKGISDSCVINVPSNYQGNTFCGKQVTKQSS